LQKPASLHDFFTVKDRHMAADVDSSGFRVGVVVLGAGGTGIPPVPPGRHTDPKAAQEG
jgi:hypothetical protein